MNNGTISGNVLTIGASSMATKKTIPTSFSNYGKVTVDLFAPGKDMVSTVTDSKYDQGDGTSFAAPVVTGVAALVWSYYPTLTHTQLKEILMKSVTNKGKKSVVKPGTEKGKKVKFADLSVSGGIINAYAALKLAEIMTVK
jgi:subtilisin family serine protease